MSARRDFGLILTGTGLAQAIPILVSPVLARLYTPSQMGDFAVFGAILAILGIVGTGRYELGVILPKRSGDAMALVGLCVGTSTLVAVVALLGGGVAALAAPSGESDLWVWLPWAGPAVIGLTWFQVLYYWNNRARDFRLMAQARVFRAIGIAATQLSLAGLGAGGLILGLVVGGAAGVSRMLVRFPLARLRRALRRRDRIRAQALRYSGFPRFSMWASLTETLGANLPVFLLALYFSPAYAGLFALAQRVIRVPVQVVAAAMGDVFRERAARQYQDSGSCRSLVVKTVALQATIGVLPAAVLFFTAGDLFAIVFGPEWRASGDITRVLAPMFFMQFLANPIGNMFIIAEKQHVDLALQVSLAAGSATALWVGATIGDDPVFAVLLYGMVYSMKYGLELTLAYRWSRGPAPSGGQHS